MRDTKQLERRIEGRTNTIARTFDRIVALLSEMDYLRDNEVTEHGKRLARLYGELDLLASECLRDGVWEGLNPAELAACVSALVYEARVSDDALAPKLPSGAAKAALGEMVRIWGRLDALEEEFKINQAEGVGQREPDLGFAWAAYMWASDKGLDEVLREAEMPAGDFVRWCKQVIDVLGQISAAAPGRAAPSGRTRARRSMRCCEAWWPTRRWGRRSSARPTPSSLLWCAVPVRTGAAHRHVGALLATLRCPRRGLSTGCCPQGWRSVGPVGFHGVTRGARGERRHRGGEFGDGHRGGRGRRRGSAAAAACGGAGTARSADAGEPAAVREGPTCLFHPAA